MTATQSHLTETAPQNLSYRHFKWGCVGICFLGVIRTFENDMKQIYNFKLKQQEQRRSSESFSFDEHGNNSRNNNNVSQTLTSLRHGVSEDVMLQMKKMQTKMDDMTSRLDSLEQQSNATEARVQMIYASSTAASKKNIMPSPSLISSPLVQGGAACAEGSSSVYR